MQDKIIGGLVGIVIAGLSSLIFWAGSTLYKLDKDVALLHYKMDIQNKLFQDLYETKKDK
jgi:hypothetical protein